MHDLQKLLIERISSGLQKKSVSTCSKWAKAYRIMGPPFPGKWSFKYHPWLKDIHDDPAERIIAKKAAQLGVTEAALNKTFYTIDILAASVLYILPTTNPDASDFSTSRFDAALELSDYLKLLFSNVKNVGHKRAGSANLWIRGSRSRSQLKSIPAALVIFDEVDEMTQENIPLAFERMSGQKTRQAMLISTPTIASMGIDRYFHESDQKHFFFRCPHCSKYIEFKYPESLVITGESIEDPKLKDSHYICYECKNVLSQESKTEYLASGKWVKSYTDRDQSGYYINQFYSSTIRPNELAYSCLKGQLSPADEQEFYNSKLGQTHEVAGARITDSDLEDCIGTYAQPSSVTNQRVITMGVDVGNWLHYEIDEWFFDRKAEDINLIAKCRTLKAGRVLNFEELDQLMLAFKVLSVVIDSQPERRKSLEFCQRFPEISKMCYYGQGVVGRQLKEYDENEFFSYPMVTVDRTTWMDTALGRFRSKRIALPKDISLEYKTHVKAPIRIYKKDVNGNYLGYYVTPDGVEDHLAHARTYSEIAFSLLAGKLGSSDITSSVT